jgi:hypothetical protein
MFSDLYIRLRSLFRRASVESELNEELRFHRDRQVEKYIQSGLTYEEAIRRFRLEFGGFDQVKEDCREARGVTFLETLAQDIRYRVRTNKVYLLLGCGHEWLRTGYPCSASESIADCSAPSNWP